MTPKMQILHDIFPAHFVVTPANHLEDILTLYPNPQQRDKKIFYVGTTRVVVTDEVVSVACDSPEGPQIIFQEKYESIIQPSPDDPKNVYRITLSSGKMIAFAKDTNCGCGSRLRGWNPYKTLISQKGVK